MQDNQQILLTLKEYELLLFFARNPNIALYREVIYEQVWEKEYTGDSRTVDLHVQRLKKKLGWDNISVPCIRSDTDWRHDCMKFFWKIYFSFTICSCCHSVSLEHG